MIQNNIISPISTQDELLEFCKQLGASNYITVDTEFIRDRTYWPQLCLIQAANDKAQGIIDPLLPNIKLQPFIDLLFNTKILKVFHAARQDIEIFVRLTGSIPKPIFDTQIAAMVCGFGDSVGYDRLVKKIVKVRIDKGHRFTDWARRPLNQKQLDYAISDVTHLRDVYKWLSAKLVQEDRAHWLDEEMAALTHLGAYQIDPETSWERLKYRSRDGYYLAILKEVAAWRERQAQTRNLPRNHIIKDEAIQEIAAEQPQHSDQLRKMRTISKGLAESRAGKEILAAVQSALRLPLNLIPKPRPKTPVNRNISATVELFKVLLKHKSDEHGVAMKLIASVSELEELADDDCTHLRCLQGWRRKIFGADALDLKNGKTAISIINKKLNIKTI